MKGKIYRIKKATIAFILASFICVCTEAHAIDLDWPDAEMNMVIGPTHINQLRDAVNSKMDKGSVASRWTLNIAYSADSMVANDGEVYVCILAHTSTAGTEPGTGASWRTYWRHNSSVGSAWGLGENYPLDAIVANEGDGYICIQAHTSTADNEPGTGASWEDYWRQSWSNESSTPQVYTSTSDPTSDDDTDYGIGDQWINTAKRSVWICMDNTDTAAEWRLTSHPEPDINGPISTNTEFAANQVHTLTVGGDFTLSVGWNSMNNEQWVEFIITGNASNSITWPTINWSSSTAPTQPFAATPHRIYLYTVNAGTTVYGEEGLYNGGTP